MKAASSEWYNTTSRHVLPTLSSNSRLFDGGSSGHANYSSISNNTLSTRRSLSFLSTSKSTTANNSFSSSFSQRNSRSRSNSTATPTTSSEQTTSFSSSSLANAQYKGLLGTLPPSLSFHRQPDTETEVSETDVAFTEDEDYYDDEEDLSAPAPTDEASSNEDNDDDDVYKSFKESLRMLRAPQSRSRSVSPAVSMRSVFTDLEEDEEDLPPDQVDDEVLSTTEEEDDDDDDVSSQSYQSEVPKSPMKVRVKVEKSVPRSDEVKVTVLLDETSEEEEDDEDEEDDDDDDNSEATTSTADTVRHLNTGGDSYDEDDTTEQEDESSSESLDSEPEQEVVSKKTESKLFHFQNGHRITSSLGDLPPLPSRIPQRIPIRSQTVHEIESESQQMPELPSTASTVTTTATASSTQSETSSLRSHSARSSLLGRSSMHKMYSVGSKVRSLSARRPLLASPHLRHLPVQLSVESPSEESPNSMKPSSASSTSPSVLSMNLSGDSTSVAMTHFASLAPPGKIPLILHHSRSLSARSSSARSRQLSPKIRQRSLGNMNPEEVIGLPPISPSTMSSASSQEPKFKVRPPLLRKLTYTICSTLDSEETQSISGNTSGVGSIPSVMSHSSSQSSIQHMQSDMDASLLSQMSTTSSMLGRINWASTAPTSQQSISELMAQMKPFPRKEMGQVSFASEVLEHSLSSYTKSTTNTSKSSSRHGSAHSSSSGSSSSKKENQDKKPEKVDVAHKGIITYGDIDQESIDDPDEDKKSQLRKFAIETVRQQMLQAERRRRGSITSVDEDDDDDDDDDEEGSSSEYSEEEGSQAEKKVDSHIPVPSEGAKGAPGGGSGESRIDVPDITQSKDSYQSKQSKTSTTSTEPTAGGINQSEESWSWKDELSKKINGEDDDDDPVPTRIPSAESGYRAMPCSPASSKNTSRQASLDSEDLEKEKDRLLSEWKKAGSIGQPPTITTTTTSTNSAHLPGWTQEIFRVEGSDEMLVRGDIDLTQEIPKEEKKLQVVWEEFNRDERSGGALADYEFSNLLDEMIQDVNSYKSGLYSQDAATKSQSSQSLQVSNPTLTSPSHSNSSEQLKFDPARKYQSVSEMVSLLSHNLRLVSSETLEDHMASLISLVSTILRKVRKNKSEDDYVAQIACLSTIRVLCDRLQEMHSSHNLKYADLSWLFRILCKYSSDSSSKIRPEASFCLAKLVKVAGPALVVRPIYFILVMESEGGQGKATTGAKTKAAAIDTLTYALLTFPKEEFHNLEEIAGWVCLSMLNEERRIRQSALECLAVISEQLGGRDKALPLFRTLFLKEEMDHFSRSPSPESYRTTKTTKSRKSGKSGGSDPVPISVHGTVRLLTGPGFPMAQPIDAITARLDKDVLPVPSTKGLIEYAVNVPTGKDLVMLMTHMLDKGDDEFDFSSSTDSLDSGSFNNTSKRSSVTSIGFSDIDWAGDGKNEKKPEETDLITPDVAFILLGKGRVNKQEVVLLDIYKKELIPELLERLNKGGGKKKRFAKLNKRRRRKRNKKNTGPRPLIPTVSLDFDDGTQKDEDDEDQDGTEPVEDDEEEESFDNENSPVAVFVDPPPDDTTPNTSVEQGGESVDKTE